MGELQNIETRLTEFEKQDTESRERHMNEKKV